MLTSQISTVFNSVLPGTEHRLTPRTASILLLMRKMLVPLALAALLATPGSAFMPTVAPVLRARSPMLSSPDARARLAGKRGDGGALFLIASTGFTVGVLGDLHLDPRKMEDYETGKVQWMPHLKEAQDKHGNVAMVSLGDLGESKSVRPAETSELFAGTTECHQLAAKFLGSFGVPYEVIGGNHDLEGLDEFDTDKGNLDMFLREHNKPHPQFVREIADKTLLVGLGSTVFRSAKYTSHEVTIDDAQVQWFEQLLIDHPSKDGWRVFVFTHAPPNGSGLRVLQENHVVNGCCWLNHSDEEKCSKFINLVREHRCVKAWFSGHFHLGQDYQDSITFPTIDPKDGPYPNRGSCVFVQTVCVCVCMSVSVEYCKRSADAGRRFVACGASPLLHLLPANVLLVQAHSAPHHTCLLDHTTCVRRARQRAD